VRDVMDGGTRMRSSKASLPEGLSNKSYSTIYLNAGRILLLFGLLSFSILIFGVLNPPSTATTPKPTAYDFDGNGIRDLLWRNKETGDLAIWLMDGSNTAVKTVLIAGVDRTWQVAGVGDFDGDNKADLLWRNTQNGDVAVWLMDGAAVKSWSTLASGLSLSWQVTGVGDLDGDSRADLLWRNTQSGDVAEWLLSGATVKSYSTLASGFDLAWQVTGVGDLDGDGKTDLVWRNIQSGDAAEWLMNGNSVKSYSLLASGLDLAWQVTGVGDLDGDGKSDLLWRNSQSGDTTEWLMNGSSVKSTSTLASALDRAWQVIGVGDLDGDGKADLVWRNTQNGSASEWLMNGAALKSWSMLYPGLQWANIPFAPIVADHLKVEMFTMNLVQFLSNINQTTITEYLPTLRLSETGGKIGLTLSVRLAANGNSFFLPPINSRIDAGSSREVLNNSTNGVAFSGDIRSIAAQISYTDDAGKSGVVTVSTLPFNAIYPAVSLDWQNQ